MEEAEQLSQLIGGVYDAALDHTLWPSVLENTCRYIRGQSGGLLAQGPQGEPQMFFVHGTAPEFLESYQKTYSALNPLQVPTILHAKAGSILASTDLVPHEETLNTRFHKEWLAPQGIIDAISVTFEKSALNYAMLAVHRHEEDGFVDDPTRRRMSLISPHCRRAVAIGRIIDLKRFEAAALADSLDGLAAATILVDPSGRITHANAAAQSMLADGGHLRSIGGKLNAADASADRALHQTFQNAERGDMAIGARGISVPLNAPDSEAWIAHVLPLTRGARRLAGVSYSAVAAVFAHKAALDVPHPLEAIATAFKLTPSEMRVLMMIINVGGVPEVAPVLGVSETTVKTHLQHIFDKTGTRRQADLVKLVAGYMSPLGR